MRPRFSRVLSPAGALLAAFALACAGDKGYETRSADEWAGILERASDVQERVRAANAFYRSPPHTYSIIHRLLVVQAEDADGVVRSMVGSALGQLQEGATSALVKSLGDTSAEVRRRAAEAIGRMKRPSDKAVEPLVKRTADPDDSVRILAVTALGAMGPTAYVARDTVRSLAGRPGPLRAAALAALPEIDTEADTFIGLFEAAMLDPSETVRLAATRHALAGARSPHHDPVPLLIRGLSDSSRAVQAAAIEVLVRARPNARAALPRLVELTRSPDENVRSLAIAAVRSLGGQPSEGR